MQSNPYTLFFSYTALLTFFLLLLVPYDAKSKCPPKGYTPRPVPKPHPVPVKPAPHPAPVKPHPVPVKPAPHPAPVKPSVKPPVVKPPAPKPSPAPQPVQPPVQPKPTKPQGQVGPPVASLLALHLPFDRRSGLYVLDTSKKANNGKISNVDVSPLPQACGLVGIFSKGSVSFNGRKFFPKPSVAVTIAMWVKLTSTAGRQSLFDAIAAESPRKQGNYHFEIVDGRVRWFTRDLDGNVVFNVVTNQVVVPANQWTHLVGTYDKQQGQFSFYFLKTSVPVYIKLSTNQNVQYVTRGEKVLCIQFSI